MVRLVKKVLSTRYIISRKKKYFALYKVLQNLLFCFYNKKNDKIKYFFLFALIFSVNLLIVHNNKICCLKYLAKKSRKVVS